MPITSTQPSHGQRPRSPNKIEMDQKQVGPILNALLKNVSPNESLISSL